MAHGNRNASHATSPCCHVGKTALTLASTLLAPMRSELARLSSPDQILQLAPPVYGSSLSLQIQLAHHPGDGHGRIVRPEDSTVLRLRVAVANALTVLLGQCLPVAQRRLPGKQGVAQIYPTDQDLLRLLYPTRREAGRREEGGVVPARYWKRRSSRA